MYDIESLISYKGRTQELIILLDGTDKAFSESRKWEILTRDLLDVCKPIIRTRNVSLDVLSYATLIMKFQEISREEIGDPNKPLEIQRRGGNVGSAMNNTDSGKRPKFQRNKTVSGKYHWCINVGYIIAVLQSKRAGNSIKNCVLFVKTP